MGFVPLSPFPSTLGAWWIVAARFFTTCAATAWYRSSDPFAGLGEPTIIEKERVWQCPRHSYRCADGELRIFMNNRDRSPYFDRRNPLYATEVDPVTFEYTSHRVVCDARKGNFPFDAPCLDMSKLCPNQGNRQLIHFRTIDRYMTSYEEFMGPDEKAAEVIAAAGIHYAEIEYDGEVPNPWEFE